MARPPEILTARSDTLETSLRQHKENCARNIFCEHCDAEGTNALSSAGCGSAESGQRGLRSKRWECR